RAETLVARRFRRGTLHPAHPVLAIRQVGELAGVGNAELHVLQVVDAAVGIVDLVDARPFRLLDVEDDQSGRAAGDVGVGASEVNAVGVAQFQLANGHRSVEARDVQYLDAVGIANISVTKLRLHGPRAANALT